ncbi:Metallo-dependent phosphatase [Pholiota conissans]|uniref:Metallo-dependent phosphatase n=1 Tax=Pholiota conissans TaxID=109636 RepID=A0A9P6CWS9_9AGAR|nr:Metallo-dependent phosphatase [Pholiota conissans]
MPQKDPHYSDVILKSPTEVVYLEYTPSRLPPKPSDEWTRFVCISDTHARRFEIPDGDVLLHSGDLTNMGLVKDFEKTTEWLYTLPHKIKIIIAGNHDLTLHTEYYEQAHVYNHKVKQDVEVILKMLKGSGAKKAGLIYLHDEEYKFQVNGKGREWSVYGSPWSPEFFDFAFGYPREDAPDLIAKFPKTDILLTHGPPFQILDQVISGLEVGCEALRDRLPELRPRLHLFGHIHEAHGACIHAWDPALGNAPPTIQNTDPSMSIDRPEVKDAEAPAETTDTELDKTVFVNAANWPMGRNAHREDSKPPFGGPGFQAVVVDLKN